MTSPAARQQCRPVTVSHYYALAEWGRRALTFRHVTTDRATFVPHDPRVHVQTTDERHSNCCSQVACAKRRNGAVSY